MIAALLGPVAARAAPAVVGYPRCNLEGVAADYVWWSEGVRVAVTDEPTLEWEQLVVDAQDADCAVASVCLAERPDMAGRAATITGTDGRDLLVGTPGPDLIVGGAGRDRIVGGGGRDTICGGPGDDLLRGGSGIDFLFGQEGSDVVRGGGKADVLDGGPGFDVLDGGNHDDLMRGRRGQDALYGGPGADDIRGGGGRDVCFGGSDVDRFTSCGAVGEDTVMYGSGPEETFRVQIDPALSESLALTTAYVDLILSDERSWIGGGTVTWRRVGSKEPADLTIILAAPATVDAICHPLDTGGYYSCRNGDTIGINVNRWNGATDWWPATLQTYRTYVINHEVGHYLGNGHASCPGPGEWANVMQQQTKRLDGCVANGWVYPVGQP